MSLIKTLLVLVTLMLLGPASLAQKGRTFYLNNQGNDRNPGTLARPWKSIEKLNSIHLKPGDAVFLRGGQQFSGTIWLDSTERGTRTRYIVLGTYGGGMAIINSDETEGLIIDRSHYVMVQDLHFRGKGRKEGNTTDGVLISGSDEVRVKNVFVEGYQKSGLSNFQSSNSEISGVKAFSNGYAGISVSGTQHKKENVNVKIRHCLAENNPGDPTRLTNHSGNGIVVSHCTRVLIENSVATNNGWDMPRKGNGPVGIWAFEADSVTIQQCIAYENKTSAGGGDGGGFDLDGGVTNSVIQYCLSYGNYGSGFGLFQYNWASHWFNNSIRHNISANDGAVTSTAAGIMVWNSSGDEKQLSACLIENNLIYNEHKPAILYDADSRHGSFVFRNNILMGKAEVIEGERGMDAFVNNLLWSFTEKLNLTSAATAENRDIMNLLKEKQNTGNINQPVPFKRPGKVSIKDPKELKLMDNYALPPGSDLIQKGFDLQAAFKKGIK